MEHEESKSRWQLEEEIAQLKKDMPGPIVAPKIFITDSTAEGMQAQLAEQHGRAAVITDEGNLFEIMAGLYSDGRNNLDVFLQGHAGGPVRVKRSGRQIFLDMIAITLGLAIQPRVIADLKSGSKQSFRGKGLWARFLFGLPKSNIGKRDIRKKVDIPLATKEAYIKGIQKLLKIPPICNSLGMEQPRRLTLSDEALELWLEFSQSIENEQGEGGKYEHIQDWTGKLPGQALRIAGQHHVAEIIVQDAHGLMSSSSTLSASLPSNFSEITASTMRKIIDFCQKLIVHTQAAFESLDADYGIADAKWALTWIFNNFEQDEKGAFFIRQNALHCSSRFKRSKLERLLKALEILRERNMVSSKQALPTRKPTYIYYVNPALCKTAA